MISIIIPSFNQQEYLADAIESCLSQECYHGNYLEIIIVDDGSTDNSLKIAESYKEKFDNFILPSVRYEDRRKILRIKIISQVNKGLASARNTGIMNAYYDWCLFLDADDMLMDGAVKKIEQAILNNHGVDIIAPSFKTFGTSNEQVILMKDLTLEDFKTGNRIGYCSAIIKSALLEVGGYSPRMIEGWEDYHLWFNLLIRGKKIVTIPEVLWLYRTKENSMWTESTKHSEKLWAQIHKDFPQL